MVNGPARTLTRRALLLSAVALAALPAPAFAAMPVFDRTAGCGCCHVWTERMAAAGMPVLLEDTDDLAAMSEGMGVLLALHGCLVGAIGGYVVSGHVPPEELRRLLNECSAWLGLVVPGMPIGSPGMELGDRIERYEVLHLKANGATGVLAVHGDVSSKAVRPR